MPPATSSRSRTATAATTCCRGPRDPLDPRRARARSTRSSGARRPRGPRREHAERDQDPARAGPGRRQGPGRRGRPAVRRRHRRRHRRRARRGHRRVEVDKRTIIRRQPDQDPRRPPGLVQAARRGGRRGRAQRDPRLTGLETVAERPPDHRTRRTVGPWGAGRSSFSGAVGGPMRRDGPDRGESAHEVTSTVPGDRRTRAGGGTERLWRRHGQRRRHPAVVVLTGLTGRDHRCEQQ